MKIGIDLGGSHISVGIIENGRIISKIEKEIKDEEKGKENIVKIIKKTIDKLLKQNGKIITDINLIGIACPGIVYNGVVKKIHNLKIEEIDFGIELGEEYKNIKINVRNDAKCVAIAEKEYGTLKEYENAILLTIGTGIGGAVFVNGKMLEGKNSSAYELGHIIINKNGKECSCKSKGCFEAYASIGNLRRLVRDELKITKEIDGKELLEILKKYKENEQIEKILNEYIKNLEIGISNLYNIFEPEVIVLGGSIVYYEKTIIEKLKNKLQKKEYIFNKESTPKILLAKFNNDAGMIGATII